MNTLRFVVLTFGAIGILISVPLMGFAVLGFLGILADVGLAENRAFGWEALNMGLPPLIVGALLCALGCFALPRNRRPADAAPGMAPDPTA